MAPSSPPTSPSDDEVFRELLEQLRQRPPRKLNASALFTLSLLLFVALGVFGGGASLRNVVCLVGVLLLHEAGHAFAMRAFGYSDVKIFFVPFLGAATGGRKTNAPVWQQSLVLLAGPLPGLVLGLSLMWFSPPWLENVPELAPLFVGLNAINLIPADPLDGGRLAGLLVFGRYARVRIVVSTVLGIGLLMLLGLSPLLQAVVLGVAVGTQIERFRTATVASRLRRAGTFEPAALPHELTLAPEPFLRVLFDAVRGLDPRRRARASSKTLARVTLGRMLHTHEVLRLRPVHPGVAVPTALVLALVTLVLGQRLTRASQAPEASGGRSARADEVVERPERSLGAVARRDDDLLVRDGRHVAGREHARHARAPVVVHDHLAELRELDRALEEIGVR
jgi:Zn-dependent protease